MTTKKEIFKAHLKKWLACKGDRKKRGEMVKEISHTAKVHEKSVFRSFKRVQLTNSSAEENQGRNVYYTPDIIAALYDV